MGPPSPIAIGALVIFASAVVGVTLLVLCPVTLRIPLPRGRRLALHIPHWVAPPLGVVLMLACGALDGPGLLAGIKGDDAIQPYSIVVLFLSLAYMASALDQTGALAWLALKLTRAASTGRRLFVLHSLLSGAVTLGTSNDLVVMSLTPIVYVQATAGGAEPRPFLATEFVNANLWSMALYIGNPTNIIVASAFNLSFLGYSRWMLAPTIAAGTAAVTVLYATNARALPPRLHLPNIPPASVLPDPIGAGLLTALMALCIALLSAAPTIGFPLWAITLTCAGAACAYTVVAYLIAPPVARAARRRRLHGPGNGRSAAALLPGEADVASSSKHFPRTAAGGDVARLPPAVAGQSGDLQVSGDALVWVDAEADAETVQASGPVGTAATGSGGGGCSSGSGAPVDGLAARRRSWEPAAAAAAAAGGDAAAAAAEGSWRTHLQRRHPSAALPAAAGDAGEVELSRAAADLEAPATPGGGAAAAAAAVTAAGAGGGARDEGSAGQGGPSPEGSSGGASDVIARLAARRPTFVRPFAAVPWDVIPLLLGFFILVEGLSANGWVDRLGALLGRSARSTASGLWAVGALAVVLANAINNLPMTICLTRAALSPAFAAAAAAAGAAAPAAARRNLQAVLFAVVVGSNTAACFTVIGALAGIMFVAICRRRGVRLGCLGFSALMAPAGAAATAAALTVLTAELTWFPAGAR